MNNINRNGMILWEGPSRIDGSPIVVIAVGLTDDSTNGKTGAMLQTYIIRADESPIFAVQHGRDNAICGDCPHRGILTADGYYEGRTCYVEYGRAPQGVYLCYIRGGYAEASGPDDIAAAGAGRVVRLGTYGDPCAVPVHIWRALVSRCVAHTGYTHQWHDAANVEYRDLCMASADSVRDMRAAHAADWRAFRVVTHDNTVQRFRRLESVCPASAEAGKKLTCIDCKACSGTSTGRKGSIVIRAHGGTAVMANVRRRYASVSA